MCSREPIVSFLFSFYILFSFLWEENHNRGLGCGPSISLDRRQHLESGLETSKQPGRRKYPTSGREALEPFVFFSTSGFIGWAPLAAR